MFSHGLCDRYAPGYGLLEGLTEHRVRVPNRTRAVLQLLLECLVEGLQGLRNNTVELEVTYPLVNRLEPFAIAPESCSVDLLGCSRVQPGP
jgi:hypothetical protein